MTGFAVMVDHPDDDAEVQRICHDIEALGPKRSRPRAAVDSVKGTTEIRFIRAMSWITSAIAIIIGVVGMLNTMIMSVAERTREIGILRAIGWKKLRIVRMIVVESVLLSLCGGVLGAVAAIGVTNLLGPASRRRRPDRHPHHRRRARSSACSAPWCIGILGAAYPAYRGAQLLPTEALRHE